MDAGDFSKFTRKNQLPQTDAMPPALSRSEPVGIPVIEGIEMTEGESQRARLIPDSRSKGTTRAHNYTLVAFKAFCEKFGFSFREMSKEAIAAFLQQCDTDKKPASFLSTVRFFDNFLD
jgi:hypothetical protein